MRKIIFYGLLGAFFFSITFPINRWLNVVEEGHWYWTASLRYIFVFLFMSIYILLRHGTKVYKETIQCFLEYWYFWVLAGGIGFGCFYLLLCYAASYSPGWVLATTWQTTILATPLVILLLGNRVPGNGVFYLILMFLGVVLVNIDEFKEITLIDFRSIVPILMAAFCYPLGNTLCKYACEGRYRKIQINKYLISDNVSSQILMMTLGALPILGIAWFIFAPFAPTNSQYYSVAFVALVTGVIATGFLYTARKHAKKSSLALAAADGTQSIEAPLALFWEFSLFGALLPSFTGFFGLLLVALGIILFYRNK